MRNKERTFVDAQNKVRCKADIRLRDGSAAQCGRREAWDGLGLCWQHQRKEFDQALSERSIQESRSPRRQYIGYRLVSLDDFDGWVAMNIDALFHNYALTGGLDLEQLAAFSAREYEHERELREGYARTAEAFDGAI